MTEQGEMTGRRFLLLYITRHSGHHRATRAIAQTIQHRDPSAHIVCVDAFRYTTPFVHWAISHSYLSLIKHQPDVWEYLYDNPAIHRRVQRFRSLLHRYHAAKLSRLLDTVQPDVIACTQAYPCGIVADFKKRHGLHTPLVGILTDHAPHLYWFHDTVDVYVVPSEQVKQRFLTRGVDPSRVRVLGIPIDPTFLEPTDRAATAQALGLDLARPIFLIMGGGSGFGRLRDIVLSLDTLPYPCQYVVLAGSNRPLLAWCHTQRFRHRVLGLGYRQDMARLMDIATLIISKPGGLTTSEALAKGLPLVIVNPIPGQEAYNARFLLSQSAAVQAESPETVRQTVRDLLENPQRLAELRRRITGLGKPAAACDVTRLLFELANTSTQHTAHSGQPPESS